MAGARNFWDYVRRAFHAKVAIRGLGSVAFNKWLLAGIGILGIGAPPLWLLGLGLEVLYLYWLATNPRFRKIVDAEDTGVEQAAWSRRVAELTARLDRRSRERLDRLAEKCRGIQTISSVLETPVPPLEDAKRSGMDQLIFMYLRLLVFRATIDANFPEGERDKLRREVERLERELAVPAIPEPVRKSKLGTVEIQKRRLENLERAAEQQATIESELERIEQQVELIREDTAMNREPIALTTRIDQVVGTLAETSDWMKRNADLLGEVGEDKPREVSIFLEPRAAKEKE